VRLGCTSPDLALLRLYCHELDEERLWEVMTAMALHDKVTWHYSFIRLLRLLISLLSKRRVAFQLQEMSGC
jgi:hypothetical protein